MASYFYSRKVYAQLQLAEKQDVDKHNSQQQQQRQSTLDSFVNTTPVQPRQRQMLAPFPEYSGIHPDHMNNEVPSYCGAKITGKFIRIIAQVCNLGSMCCNNCLVWSIIASTGQFYC